jgi:hypothetical protein
LRAFFMETPGAFFSILNFLLFPVFPRHFSFMFLLSLNHVTLKFKTWKFMCWWHDKNKKEWGKMCGGILTLIYKNERVLWKKLRWFFNQNPKFVEIISTFPSLDLENFQQRKNLLKFPSSEKRTHLFD